MVQKVLVVEDQESVSELLRSYLEQTGFDVTCIATGTTVVAWVKENSPDLILLDWMLPGKTGLDICKEIRTFSEVPIIMVTARVEEIDRLLGLGEGADDYICKPFSPREVVARVKSVLRRTSHDTAQQKQILELDMDRYQAVLLGHKLDLTALEFHLLSLLATKPGKIFSRDQLMENIYRDQRVVCDRTIDSHIKKLRKKITAISPQRDLIHSVYGVGYKYEDA